MNEIPPGFDGLYRCKRHPERDAVAPIAMRWCEQCLDDAKARYAGTRGPTAPASYPTMADRGPDDLSILADMRGEYKPQTKGIL